MKHKDKLLKGYLETFLGLIGYIASLLVPLDIWMPMQKDRMDVWSFSHAYATAILYFILLHFFSWTIAAPIAWVLMYLYEIIIDGNKIEDVRGASRLDIGFNTLGIFIAILIYR